MRALYLVERQAQSLTGDQRRQLLQEKTSPLLTEFRERLLSWKEQLLPRHPMAEAIPYA